MDERKDATFTPTWKQRKSPCIHCVNAGPLRVTFRERQEAAVRVMEGPELSEEGQRVSGTKQGAVDLRAQGQPGIWRKGTGMCKGAEQLGSRGWCPGHMN